MANGNNNKEQLSIAEVFGEKSKDGDDILSQLKKLISAPGNWLGTPYGGYREDVPMERPSYPSGDDPDYREKIKKYYDFKDREYAGKENVDYLRKGKYKKELPSFPYIAQTPLSRGTIPDQSWSRGDEITNILASLILGGGLGVIGKAFSGAKGNKPINVPDKKHME